MRMKIVLLRSRRSLIFIGQFEMKERLILPCAVAVDAVSRNGDAVLD